jgi:hypothetical protein
MNSNFQHIDTRGRLLYNAYVILEQDLEMLQKSVPAELDPVVGLLVPLGISLAITCFTTLLPPWADGMIGTISGGCLIGSLVRFVEVKKRRNSLLALIDRIKQSQCQIEPKEKDSDTLI